MSVLYLYAVVGELPRREAGRGLRRERLETLPGRGFHVVAGRMEAPPEAATATLLRRHDATVRRIAATVDAILPIRFGTVVPDEETAARWLLPRAFELVGRLVHVRGCEQMTLRLFQAHGPVGRRVRAAGVPEPAGLGPGARHLVNLRRRHEAAVVPELDAIHRLLDRLVVDERVQHHTTPPLLASVYHLVPRARRAQYRTRVARAAATLSPLRLSMSGPWPPYAFGTDAWP